MRFKYVIFSYTPSESVLVHMPVFFPEHVTHSMVMLENPESLAGVGDGMDTLKPHSAGFFRLEKGRVVIEDRKSESMDLGPSEKDELLISHALLGSGTMAFTTLFPI